MKLKKLIAIPVVALLGLAFLTFGGVFVVQPDTYRTVHGVALNGAPYTAIFVDHHPSPFVAWAQTTNARGQNAGLAYESQQFGAATTATAASVGAAASDTLTWGVPFPDTNYQVSCTLDGVVTAFPVTASLTKTATAVVFTHIATTAAAASTAAPGFDCIAVHQ